GGTRFPRNNISGSSDTAPFTVTWWDPNVNGAFNPIAFNNGNCATAYIGGQFTSVGGTAVKNIAAVNTATGAVGSTFKHNAGGQVETILAGNGHPLTGGIFQGINRNSANPVYSSPIPTT